MIISGLQNTTLLDYPGHVAATIFLGGCNYRCPFCHNASIVMSPTPGITREELMSFLKKRSGILDGVCVTGGEPTISQDLLGLLADIKALGLLVKLDTNGTNPEIIKKAVDMKLLDYIAMDIKSSRDGYGRSVGIDGYDTSTIEESIRLIMECGIEYEFRTTLVKNIHTLSDMKGIGELIGGARAYYIQSYRDNDLTIEKELKGNIICDSFDKKELEQFLMVAREKISSAMLRGVD